MFTRQFTQHLRHVSSRSASTLVIAEHGNGAITNGTLSTVTAASKIGGDITVLVAGKGSDAVAQKAAGIAGVKKVLFADDSAYDKKIAESLTALVVNLQKTHSFSHILTPSSNAGKNFLPRVGAELDVAPISDITEVVSEDTFKRPMYAGNAIATVKSKDSVKLITVRGTSFDKAAIADAASASTEAAAAVAEASEVATKFVSEEVSKSDRPDLGSARVVISGGRGLKSGENFAMLEKLADKLGGAVGASRAAVDAGFVPNEYQVGQTGKVVAPDFYLAVGISGAIQHLAGMKDSKTIACINKDEEAPIFQVSDYGLVEDLFKAVPELTEKI